MSLTNPSGKKLQVHQSSKGCSEEGGCGKQRISAGMLVSEQPFCFASLKCPHMPVLLTPVFRSYLLLTDVVAPIGRTGLKQGGAVLLFCWAQFFCLQRQIKEQCF